MSRLPPVSFYPAPPGVFLPAGTHTGHTGHTGALPVVSFLNNPWGFLCESSERSPVQCAREW